MCHLQEFCMAFSFLFESHNWCLICSWEPGSLSWHVSDLTDCLCLCVLKFWWAQLIQSVFTGSKQQHVMQLEIPYHPSWELLLRHQELLLNKGLVSRQKTCLLLQTRVWWLMREAMTSTQGFPSFQWCVTIQRALKMSADKGSLSRTDIVLEWENTESGWAVIFWWDKPPEFPFLRHLLHKCMLGIARPPNILQWEEGAERKRFWTFKFSGVLVLWNTRRNEELDAKL